MNRSIWVYRPDHPHANERGMVPKDEAPPMQGGVFHFLPDIKEFVSPVGFERITSRSQLREHERRHGVRQCGELKTAQEFSNESRRTDSFGSRAFDQAFRAAVEKTGI